MTLNENVVVPSKNQTTAKSTVPASTDQVCCAIFCEQKEPFEHISVEICYLAFIADLGLLYGNGKVDSTF